MINKNILEKLTLFLSDIYYFIIKLTINLPREKTYD